MQTLLVASAAFGQTAPSSPTTSQPTSSAAGTGPIAFPLAGAARTVAPGDRELAESFVLDARLSYVPADVLLYIRRGENLCRMAIQLDPYNAMAYRLWSEAAESRRDAAVACEAEFGFFQATGLEDYRSFCRWLGLKLAGLQTAEDRAAFLDRLCQTPELPDACKAVAWSNLGAIRQGQDDTAATMAAYRKAAELDPGLPEAVSSLGKLEGAMATSRQTQRALGLLRANPVAVDVAWNLGHLFRSLGLYAQAVTLYDHCRAVAAQRHIEQNPAFRLDYVDALLDAGMAQRVVDEFAETVKAEPVDMGLAPLMAEAYRLLDRAADADALVARMYELNKRDELLSAPSAQTAGELAWFHLVYRQHPETAEKWAAIAIAKGKDDPTIQRIWAMSLLAVGKTDEVKPVLTELAKRDPFAVGAMVKRAYDLSEPAEAEKITQTAADMSRFGAPWRYLAGVVRSHKAELPKLTDRAQTATAEFAGFDPGYLRMGSHPDEFLTVKLQPVADELAAGDPVIIKAVLTNIGACRSAWETGACSSPA